ncbi:hypothetical protein DXA50_11130 [Butyricimonas virosa]|jgi:hypothetical protein|uniref:DUF5675 domain-containing protein n=1 Tax=Butyricimonas virosa TaxID=544645 RepID=A0A413IMC4_9BACT|nr:MULTISPECIES: DUF5675 family protein [Butyricimonas]MBO4958955.1 hypothetical protein [Butyricimonas sp.]MCI6414045.1 DUF5675 family protein [Butyricimonas virosa]MCI7163483.1 DUF5675 family protein [Butyricimonas virosa]MCI7292351.1 DUF5675 family protein [Butyricimonas virosa]MDY5532394.1 DUF5675 family protein [Butyricimonas virosa]
MMLELNRIAKKPLYTIGRLFVDRKYFCDTLEDCCRDLDKEEKVMNETAIPEGTYEVIVNVSAKFRRKLPLLLDVPHFSGIRIHRGNTDKDTSGCILVGENKQQGRVINSTGYELKLTEMIEKAMLSGEKIVIQVR